MVKLYANHQQCMSFSLICFHTGNNFSLFYAYAQARLKLPKKDRNALVGAANVLVADSNQNQDSPTNEDEDSDNGKTDIDGLNSLEIADTSFALSKR